MNMIAKSTVAASVVPAALMPLPASATAPLPKHVGPTVIGKLDEERRALLREIGVVRRNIKKLDAELKRQMPKPHPSITYSAENDEDGLKYYLPDREPHTLHRYISSPDIEGAVKLIEEPGAAIEHINGEMVVYLHRSQPMSEEDAARRDRLLARLGLAREYEKRRDKIDRNLGLTRLNKKLENNLWPHLSDLEKRIYAAPAVTRADLNVKLTLYSADKTHDDWLVKRLFRDLRRLAAIAPLPVEA
jgi:hypothetical protein